MKLSREVDPTGDIILFMQLCYPYFITLVSLFNLVGSFELCTGERTFGVLTKLDLMDKGTNALDVSCSTFLFSL